MGRDEPDRGTWFSMRLIIEPPANFEVKYNYQNLPNWGTPTAENFTIDLERYPRSGDNMPDWFLSNLPDHRSEE